MLTPKEIEVLELRYKGLTQTEVAVMLKISQAAVSKFEKNALKKISEAQTIAQVAKRLRISVDSKTGEIKR